MGFSVERGTSHAQQEEVSLLCWSTAGKIHALLPARQIVIQVFMPTKVRTFHLFLEMTIITLHLVNAKFQKHMLVCHIYQLMEDLVAVSY